MAFGCKNPLPQPVTEFGNNKLHFSVINNEQYLTLKLFLKKIFLKTIFG